MQAWLTAAMFAPLAHYSGGSWPVLLVLSLLSLGLTGLLPEDPGEIRTSKALCLLELIWILILGGHYLSLSAAYWPGERSELVVPAVLLVLGGYSCTGRPDRTAGVLFWMLLLLLIPFGLAAVRDARSAWILPEKLQCSAWVVPILLLPAAACWCVGKDRNKSMTWKPYLLGLGTWCATSAVLSPNIAMALELPFRDLSRSLDLGAGSRFESLASVLITLGWYALAALLVKLSVLLLKELGVRKKLSPWLAVTPMIGLSWLNVQPNPLFSAGMTLVLWVFVPLLHSRKNSKKSEKRA